MKQSSLKAHEHIKPHKQTHYTIIKSAMFLLKKPSTGKTIARNCSLSYHEVMRRLSEMREKSIISEFGRDDKQKFKPTLWVLND